jgi:uncharacterized protein involved in cysteine biosynthesis
MSWALLLQYLVIALAVLISAWVVLVKQFPATARRLRTFIALPLLRSGSPHWLQLLGRRIATPVKNNRGGCSGCDNCGPDKH